MKRLQAYDSEFARMREERREDASDLRDELRGDIKVEKGTISERLEQSKNELSDITRRKVENILSSELINLREERRKDAADLRDELRGDIKEEKKASEVRFQETKQDLSDITQKEVEDALREGAEARTAELNAHFATLQEKSIEIEREISDKFGVLVEFPSIKSMADDRPASAGVAHRNISILFQLGKIDEAVAYTVALLEKLKTRNVSGTPNDWFNISSVLGSNDQEKLGFEICLAAIEYYRGSDGEIYVPNIDLLAHGIQFAGKSAEYEQGLLWIAEASENGRAHWSWRMYIFVADFYDAIGDSKKLEEVEKAFRENLPDDQRSVTNTAVRLKQAGNNKDAYALVSDWIKAYEERHERKPIAETAYFLLTDISIETGKFKDALTYSALALGASIGDQPSVSISAIWFYRASAFDALFGACITDNSRSESYDMAEAKRLYESAANGYQAAINHPKTLNLIMEAQAKLRMHDMKALILEHGLEGDIPPVDQAEQQEQNQAKQMQGQISQLHQQQEQIMQVIQKLDQKLKKGPE